MIEEQFVSFDTAKLLKEAGFREHCRCMYFPDKDGSHKICQNIIADYNVTDDEKYEAGDYYGYGDCYLAPTQALAARWLREVYGIMIVSFFDDYMSKWYYVIDGVKKQSGIKCVQSASDYDNYETALEDGLKEAIKLIKK